MAAADPRASTSRARPSRLFALVAVALLAGCSAATTGSPTSAALSSAASSSAPAATPAPTPTPTPAAASTSTPAGTSGPTAVPTSVDPCQLVTSQEASQLAGASFGAGKEETTSGNGRLCVYGYQTLNVFTVEVAQAPNLAAAQAAKAEALAGIQELATKGVTLTQLPNLADGAVVAQGGATISGQTFSVSSIGVLKGTIFFGFSDLVLGHPAPSSAALQAQAQTCLGRLP